MLSDDDGSRNGVYTRGISLRTYPIFLSPTPPSSVFFPLQSALIKCILLCAPRKKSQDTTYCARAGRVSLRAIFARGRDRAENKRLKTRAEESCAKCIREILERRTASFLRYLPFNEFNSLSRPTRRKTIDVMESLQFSDKIYGANIHRIELFRQAYITQ